MASCGRNALSRSEERHHAEASRRRRGDGVRPCPGLRPDPAGGAYDPGAHDGHHRRARGLRRDARGGAAGAPPPHTAPPAPPPPPLRCTARAPARRPTDAEDPFGSFIPRCRVAGAASGPLHGRTVALKDHIALAGVPMTFSSHMMDGYVPDFDATVVTRLLEAGATITGKLKLEEFSWGGPGLSGV